MDKNNDVRNNFVDDENNVLRIWAEFANVTSSHGIQHVDHAQSDKYMKYEVDVNFRVEHSKSAEFPAVTICNTNAIKKSALNKLKINCTPTILEKLDKLNGLKFESNYEKHQEMYESLNEDIKHDLGHKLNDLFWECEFAGVECSEEDFVHFSNYLFGNCFTFNSARNNGSSITSRLSGPKYGLSITFNVEEDEYIGETSESAGLRVVVHDPRKMPFPEDEGVLVAPRTLTHIGVRMVREMVRMNGSYGNCYAEGLPKLTKFQTVFNKSYCQKSCYYSCIAKSIYHSCSCIYVEFSIFASVLGKKKICSSSNQTENECVFNILNLYENDRLGCTKTCPPPCRELSFVTLISSSKWPSRNYKKKMNPFINMLTRNVDYIFENSGSTTDDISSFNHDDTGKVMIYYENLFHQLLSDIGGVLGLYVGFSVLTVIEFIELLINLVRAGVCRRCSGKNKEKKIECSI
ncbi:hypothetical protein HELRODRAFT_168352 [Helobdella robusta]|uniref:Uncharacterized protein n=1 Tax=Helobdella robusta TaxID=6412 RepID=T1F0G2_HELRO|nr:hypothetical protein HELRODRAFT_168352 [Helobdella robusta]ESO09372.1 hypothetical protein HELRODRAFT_168352 [Helobdella robusta]